MKRYLIAIILLTCVGVAFSQAITGSNNRGSQQYPAYVILVNGIPVTVALPVTVIQSGTPWVVVATVPPYFTPIPYLTQIPLNQRADQGTPGPAQAAWPVYNPTPAYTFVPQFTPVPYLTQIPLNQRADQGTPGPSAAAWPVYNPTPAYTFVPQFTPVPQFTQIPAITGFSTTITDNGVNYLATYVPTPNYNIQLIQTPITGLNSKAVTMNTGAVAGTVGLSAGTTVNIGTSGTVALSAGTTVADTGVQTPVVGLNNKAVTLDTGKVAFAATPSANVGGLAASGAAVVGNPLQDGGRASTTYPTSVSDGQAIAAMLTKSGKFVSKLGSPRELISQGSASVSTTAETTLLSAGASGVFLDLTEVIADNRSATAVKVDFRDATSGTIRFTINLPANNTIVIPMDACVNQTTAANNWTIQLGQAVTTVDVFAQAIQEK